LPASNPWWSTDVGNIGSFGTPTDVTVKVTDLFALQVAVGHTYGAGSFEETVAGNQDLEL
jgi:hypothetical protein